MNKETMERIVRTGESETVEFKKSTAQLRPAMETLCGMLNRFGGQVLFGVSPEGRIVGQSVSDKTFRGVSELIRHLEPPVYIAQSRVELDNGKEILILQTTPNLEQRPYVFEGRPYQRIGSSTSIMPQKTYQRLIEERSNNLFRWENKLAPDYSFQDLDREEIFRTIRLGIQAGRIPESIGNDVPDILNRLGLVKNNKLSNAGVVLFGTTFLPNFPQCHLRLAHFRGINKSSFLDQRQMEGNAFRLLEEAMLFLRRNLPVSGRVIPGLFEREDEPLFPLEALREALVNAFCHRDYTIIGGAVSLAIYDDRLEIWSDGILPYELTPELLKQEHSSKPRNPIIAKVFYLRGIIESWGRGTQKIVELCLKAGQPEPEFGEKAGSVWVRFLPNDLLVPQQGTQDLSYHQREILEILSREASVPFRGIRERIPNPPPDRSLREELYHLKKLGLIDFSGFGRGASWHLIRKTSEPPNKTENKAGKRQK